MNAPVMITNREYVENLHAIESNVNLRLLVSASKFYKEHLDADTRKQLFALPLKEKIWLTAEYEQELTTYQPADLDNPL
jgi:hypothetical protein